MPRKRHEDGPGVNYSKRGDKKQKRLGESRKNGRKKAGTMTPSEPDPREVAEADRQIMDTGTYGLNLSGSDIFPDEEKKVRGLKRGNGRKSASWSDDPGRVAKDGEHLAALEAGATTSAVKIELPKLDIRTLTIRIVGDSELVMHKWSAKARKQMLDKQMGVATSGKEAKDPERDYQESMYTLPNGDYCFPSIAFKNAAVTACTSLGRSAISKVAARQAFHVVGEMVRIEGTPRMREDMVKIAMGTADIRFRGGFVQWACNLTLRYNARVLTAEQVINLLNIAGFAVGVGEWRPERDGAFGQFHVETE